MTTKVRPDGVIATVLSCALAACMVAVVIGPMVTGKSLTPEQQNGVQGVFMAVIAIISNYLGATRKESTDGEGGTEVRQGNTEKPA